ncbi:MAG: hypothetical protein U1E30_04755 [Rhodoblastus sp.]
MARECLKKPLAQTGAYRMVVFNSVYNEELSSGEAPPAGMAVTTLAAALASRRCGGA